MLAACSESADLEQAAVADANPQAAGSEVAFDTYMGMTRSTRGGAYGSIDTDRLKQPGYGFGVFAYKTGTQTYMDYRTQNAQTRRYPNFMYNEPIVYDATKAKWVYMHPENTRYWPNEVADSFTDDQNDDAGNDRATTDYQNGGNVSFFAYAPYTTEGNKETTPDIIGQAVTSSDDGGILFFSTGNFNGGTATATAEDERYKFSDPYVKYKIAAESSRQVDLLWATTLGSSENVLSQGTQPGVSSELYPDFWNDGTEIKNDYVTTPSDPVILRPVYNVPADLTKQKTNGTVNLLFKHALAKVGGSYIGTGDGSDEDGTTPTNGLMVILDIDKDGYEVGGSLYPYAEGPKAGTPYNTKVTINEVVLVSEKQLTAEGMTAIKDDTAFDYTSTTYTETLRNTGIFNLVTGVWSAIQAETYTSGVTKRTQTIVPSVNAVTDATRDAILNHNVAEPASYTTTAYTKARYEELPVGVTTVAKNVYESDTQPFIFIPGTYPIITITIDYTVRSYDAKLADNYTEVRQRITKRLYILDEIQLNKQYNILMHLGLTSVKLTATVSDWETKDATATTVTTPTDGTSPVATYDQDVEHVHLPINVAALREHTPTTFPSVDASAGVYDLGTVTLTYDDDKVHTSREPAMTFTLTPALAGASIAADTNLDSATFGHVFLTLPQNTAAASRTFNVHVVYGDNAVDIPVTQKAAPLP